MIYDYKKLYEKNATFFRERVGLTKVLRIFNKLSTALFFVAYGVFLVYAIKTDYTSENLIKILGAPALCLFLVTVLRLAVDRPRPYDEAGAGITPLHNKKGDGKSFPSRHLACAFVIATTLLPYALWASIPLFVIGLCLAYARFALGLHYPSDLFFGILLGVGCGLLPLLF